MNEGRSKVVNVTKVRRFGLIGHPLGHSLSPLIHERIMEVVGIKGEYKLYDLKPQELKEELPKLISSLDGFNCTIPYKQAVIPYLQTIAPCAEGYGAVNTVYRGVGYNTDGAGFIACQVPMKGKNVCVLGAGGVARVLALEAARAGAREVLVQARNKARASELVEKVRSEGFNNVAIRTENSSLPNVILNGTPVGMWPNQGELPTSEAEIVGADAVFDTIYNPTATRLVLTAKSQGVWAKGGLQMLFEQALAAQQIWHPDLDFSSFQAELSRIPQSLAREVLQQNPLKLVFTGFMGSGKTHIGSRLAKRMHGDLPFLDLDQVIAERAQKSIKEIFQEQGEAAFRALERECLLELLKRPGSLLVASGGGALCQPELVEKVRNLGGLVIYLDVPFEVALKRMGADLERPLLQGGLEKVQHLYNLRKPLYKVAADLTVPADRNEKDVVDFIMEAFEWDA